MAESVEGEGFWLPAEFLTDDDFLPGKENLNKSCNAESLSELRFPTEFPYDFETERKQIPEKLWLMSTSPQSTLTPRMGSWTARSAGGSSNVSPNSATPAPKTQFAAQKYDVVGDLVYRAAGQVMKLKLNHGDVLAGLQPTRVPPRSRPQFYPDSENPCNPPVFPHRNFQQHNECCGEWYSQQRVYQNRGVRSLPGAGQTAWTIQQNPTRVRAVSFVGGGGGAAARRGSAGTGVFLPRRSYGNNNNNDSSSDSHMTTGCSAPLFHGRPSANSGMNLDNINPIAQSRPHPRFNRGFVPNYNQSMVRRQAIVLHERQRLLNSLIEGSSMVNRDLLLPRDWTY
ncbi:hypothetical protein ACP275_06G072900 [Erythranthe tilingii]